MKILFFHIGTPAPILETELELACKHEKDGDTIRGSRRERYPLVY